MGLKSKHLIHFVFHMYLIYLTCNYFYRIIKTVAGSNAVEFSPVV